MCAWHPMGMLRVCLALGTVLGAFGCSTEPTDVAPALDLGVTDSALDTDATIDAATDASVTQPLACVGGYFVQALGESTTMTLSRSTHVGASDEHLELMRRTLDASSQNDIGAFRRERVGSQLAFAYVDTRENPHAYQELNAHSVRVVEPLPKRFAVVQISAQTDLEQTAAIVGVHALAPVRAADKLDSTLVRAHDPVPVELYVTEVSEAGSLESRRVYANANQARALAAHANVLHVERYHAAQPLLEEQRAAVHADEVTQYSLVGDQPVYAGFTGRGVRLSINDSGIDLTHPDFQNYDSEGNVTTCRIVGVGSVEGQGHGTSVAGIAAGNGRASATHFEFGRGNIPFLWRGVAPEVDTIISVWMNDPERAGWLSSYTDGDAYLSNHSHTLSVGDYNVPCSHWDIVTRYGVNAEGVARPARPTVFAAANSGAGPGSDSPLRGFYSVLAPLKNSITVGATYTNDDAYAVGSSAGPTLDGRLKPDVMAPGFRDTRPPEGLWPEIDEIHIVPREGSSAPEIVYTMDEITTADGWSMTGAFALDTTADGVATAHITGVGNDAFQFVPESPLDTAEYDQVSFRMRLPIGGVAGKHRFPLFWVVGFSHDEAMMMNGATYPTFDPANTDAEWHTHSTSMAALGDWTGTVTRIVVTPVVYDDRPVSPWIGGGYQRAGGTSMAAPVVSGIYSLMMEALATRHGVDLENAPPFPSTFRALVIHTAQDMERASGAFRDPSNQDIMMPMFYPRGPDFATGYGLVNAKTVIDLLAASEGEGQQRWSENQVDDGEVVTYEFDVDEQSTSTPLRATLAWDDLAGSALLAVNEPQLVNDLDIVLVDPAGNAHSPWILNPLPFDRETYLTGIDPITPADIHEAPRCSSSVYWQGESTRTCEDHLNNVEQVIVDVPMAGRWRMLVRGHTVTEGPQPFTVVLTQSC